MPNEETTVPAPIRARPSATGMQGDAHATRLVRVEMALDDLKGEIRDMTRAIRESTKQRAARVEARTEFCRLLVSQVLQPKVLWPIGVLLLGCGALATGASLTFGDYLSLGGSGDAVADTTEVAE